MPNRRLAALALTAAAAASTVVGQGTSQQNTQFWHEQYHGILSMAAYGDYADECPQQKFTEASLQNSFPGSTEQPWTLLGQWGPTASGISGFNVIIPEMDKVIMVFSGVYGWETLNMTPASLDSLGIGAACAGCTAHAGALQAYLEAKEANDNFTAVAAAVNRTSHQWSVTGHQFGGMVAQIAALDLGWKGLVHWSHNHGSPRVFNPAAANLYNRLFEGEASQRCVANNDSVPNTIPESDSYTHAASGFAIWGTNTTYGMNWATCTVGTDPVCLGGDTPTDNLFYYTQQGSCGGIKQVNHVAESSILASESAAFYATATANLSTMLPSSSALNSSTVSSLNSTTSSSTSSSLAPTVTSTAPALTVTAIASSPSAVVATASPTRSTSSATSFTSSSAAHVVAALVAVAGLFATLA